ncbi:MAG: hypothetical protein B7Y45_11785 [Sphingomonas sp. 28-66-16]|nr:MAG: hypothetical protein B7Y45_11785 [Sphingomonas sp. 28-66-16]
MKLAVPAGFMPVMAGDGITIEICSGTGPATSMVMPMPGMKHRPGEAEHGKAESPCAFAGLTAPALGGADPIQLVIAIAVVLALALMAAPAFAVRDLAHLRPPSRGPPARH